MYWCYTCEAWRVPRGADECAAWDHFVVSEEKKAQIDQEAASRKVESKR